LKDIKLHQALLVLSRFAAVTRSGVNSAQAVMAMERLHMGDPDARGTTGAAAEADEMTPEDAIMHLERGVQILERKRRKAAGPTAAKPDPETQH
jgi:hypothetical protein